MADMRLFEGGTEVNIGAYSDVSRESAVAGAGVKDRTTAALTV